MPAFFKNARDPVSCYSHFIGAVLSLVGLAVMAVHFALDGGAMVTAVSSLLFCVSLFALYSASGVYHYSNGGEKVRLVLRKLDHAMIYVLIAGSYTPVLTAILPRREGILFIAGIWVFAAAGILFKLCWINAPRWLGTMLYLVLGWAILVNPGALANLSLPAVALLAAGGLLYTVGGVIYIIKKPNFSKTFGFHELFHIFVVLGSVCHYFMVLFFIA